MLIIKSKKILCTHFSKGSTHDFKLYQLSKITTKQSVLIQADSGYQGIQQAHANSQLPKKKTKLKPLTKIDKKASRKLSSKRVTNEHIIGKLKRFNILSCRHRNAEKDLG